MEEYWNITFNKIWCKQISQISILTLSKYIHALNCQFCSQSISGEINRQLQFTGFIMPSKEMVQILAHQVHREPANQCNECQNLHASSKRLLKMHEVIYLYRAVWMHSLPDSPFAQILEFHAEWRRLDIWRVTVFFVIDNDDEFQCQPQQVTETIMCLSMPFIQWRDSAAAVKMCS